MGEDDTEMDKEILKVEVYNYEKRRNMMWDNLDKIYTMILGH